MDKLKIRVTEKNIREGKAQNSMMCPVSLAVKRATGKTEVRTYPYTGVYVDDARYKATTERSLAKFKQFIVDVDAGLLVKPIRFTLGRLSND